MTFMSDWSTRRDVINSGHLLRLSLFEEDS